MLFKNAVYYSVEEEFDIQEQMLIDKEFVPCSSQELEKKGWIEFDNQLIYGDSRRVLLTLRTDKKNIRNDVIKKRLKEMEEKNGKPSRIEKEEWKDQIIMELAPKEEPRTSVNHALILKEHNLLIVDCNSEAKADDLTSFLRETLGSLPIRSIDSLEDRTLTSWVSGMDKFEVGYSCELKDDEGAKAVLSDHQIKDSEEVKKHIDDGKLVKKLALSQEDKVSFVVDQNLNFKKIKFSDELKDLGVSESEEEVNQADFEIMCSIFSELVDDLINEEKV